MTITGWLFDVYPSPKGVTLWFIDQNGAKYCCCYAFRPSFYLHLNKMDWKRAEVLSAQCPAPVSLVRATQTELFSGKSLDVLQVFVHDTTRYKNVVRYYQQFFPHFVFFNSDILVEHLFLYDTQLFPLAFGEYEISEGGELLAWTMHDSRGATDYALPPLSIMRVRNANDFVPPKYQHHLYLEVAYDGATYSLEQETPADVLESLNWHLHHCDPDIILTDHGDAVLLPTITALARRYHTPLLLNRDPSMGYFTTRESSFFQYGKIVHKDGAFELAGRWHVDVENSFTVVESDLDGLFEIVRLTQTCGQHQSRASIGTSMASLQLSWAYRNNVLIPAKKREPEEFKSAATLILADRGGLIFQPPPGYHEDVAEIDFVSMYPSIMVNRNVSPETINCRCCRNDSVPELGYTICEKREGIVPATLRMVVDKRAYYKKQKKKWKGKDETLYRRFDRRQNALKWMLVSCFGYLGYKNARFGKIEAHESVNAFSRDVILTAKEIAEAKGFHMLHAIIDCLWLKKEGATEADYEALCREIHARIGIDISLEGMYRWILFPSSKVDPVLPTANRYVGWYRHGELKVRGIEVRRRDTPKFIKRMQGAMFERMARAGSIAELEQAVPELLEIAGGFIATLRSGNARPMELVIRKNISQEAEEYSNNSISASVAKAIEEAGVHLSAGERIEYILIDSTGKRQPFKAKPVALYAFEDGYDIEKYSELTLKAVETLLLPFGYDVEHLCKYFDVLQPRKRMAYRHSQPIPVYDSLFSVVTDH